MATLREVLEDLKKKFGNIRDKAEEIGDEGEPTNSDKQHIAGWLDDAQAHIDVIFDANAEPSLDPPDAGSDPGVITWPESRLEICEDACDEADNAYDAMVEQTPPDDEACGTALKALDQAYIPKIKDEFDIA